MINIEKLEKRWLRYKLKLFLPYIILFLLTVLFTIILFITINSSNSHVIKNKVPILHEKNISMTTKIESAIVQNIVIKKEKLTLSPSLSFLKTIQRTPPLKSKVQKNTIDYKKTITKERVIKKILADPYISKTITIDRQNREKDILDVIRRFNTSHNPALSLFISKKYFEMGKYKEAYNYALLTNEINSNIEDSWILFSKSLVKLNKKKKAISVLKRYISHTNSTKATQLLNKIIQGEF